MKRTQVKIVDVQGTKCLMTLTPIVETKGFNEADERLTKDKKNTNRYWGENDGYYGEDIPGTNLKLSYALWERVNQATPEQAPKDEVDLFAAIGGSAAPADEGPVGVQDKPRLIKG